SIAGVAPTGGGFTSSFAVRPWNAILDIVDDRGVPHPYLAEALPQLNTDSWIINPDGTMETRYQLKPGLTWQDGQPLTAGDFTFAFSVYSPSRGFVDAAVPPLSEIADVQAPDDRTVQVHWKRLFPGAAVLQTGGTVL